MVSKTKVGATFIGVSAILGTVGSYMNGMIDLGSFIQAIIAEVGVVLGIYGIRDLPLINRKKIQ